MEETICAISTPPGIGGIAVVRVSGTDAIGIVGKIWQGKSLDGMASHTVHLGTVVDSEGQPLDQAVLTIFRAPASFTGEDVVELSVHGSKYVQRELLQSLIHAGARLAHPGEFTRRAFTAGKMDLAQAEAVADVIASSSRAAHRIAMTQMRGKYSARLADLRDKLLRLASLLELELDFSDEEVEFASRKELLSLAENVNAEVTRLAASFRAGVAIKEGIPIAIVGETNSGKSSLLNALLGDDKAIVSDIHGTTRDIVEDTVEIGSYTFRFMDTAGLRETTDKIEKIGIERAYAALERAKIIILVTDITKPFNPNPLSRVSAAIAANPETRLIVAANKTDIASNGSDVADITARLAEVGIPGETPIITLSAKTGQNLDQLQDRLLDIASSSDTDDIMVTNLRHYEALKLAAESSRKTIEALRSSIPADLVTYDLRDTITHLGAITGTITSEDILTSIFTRFCIGK